MAGYASNVSAADLLSEDGSYRMMARDGYTRQDERFVFLNDALERALAHILQHGYDIEHVETPPPVAQVIKEQILKWARHIQEEVPGYTSWQETYAFTFDALHKADAIPGADPTPVGTERDLWREYFDEDMKRQYDLGDSAAERAKLDDHAAALETARVRLDVLGRLLNIYTPENPMSDSLALLFRKVRYTYKLREALLGHVGYYNGSLEFTTDMSEGIHRHMYLLDLKLRRPDRMHPFRAPKHPICYQTDPRSELPWNNEFSFCYGFHEFGPTGMPRFCVNFIERQFVGVIRGDMDGQKWARLCKLMAWDAEDASLLTERSRILEGFTPAEGESKQLSESTTGFISPKTIGVKLGYFLAGSSTLSDYGFRLLTLKNIIQNLAGPLTENEVKLKDFYAHVLALPWSDNELKTVYNPFAQLYLERAGSADLTLPNADASAIKDPRVAGENAQLLVTLKDVTRDPIVVGRKANFILDPETTAKDFRRKLALMTEEQLDKLYSNVSAYPKSLSHAEKIDAVVKQAVDAASAWIRSANANRRPVYTAPSGHMVTHFCEFRNHASGCTHADHPTLEQFRLTMIATMIGFKQHHSYEEAIFPTHGFEHDGHILEYKDRKGYRDIIDSDDPFIHLVGERLVAAASTIAHQAIASFDALAGALEPALPNFDQDAKEWFETATGKPFSRESE